MVTHIARIFMNGRSQAVRLPKEFRFDCDEVYVVRHGDSILISPVKPSWDEFFDQKSAFDESFLIERNQDVPQEREFD